VEIKNFVKKTKSESKTYQTTDNDECTVSPSSHGMPKVYDTDAAVSSASSKSISSLSSFCVLEKNLLVVIG
jgi:hypothetical protein